MGIPFAPESGTIANDAFIVLGITGRRVPCLRAGSDAYQWLNVSTSANGEWMDLREDITMAGHGGQLRHHCRKKAATFTDGPRVRSAFWWRAGT